MLSNTDMANIYFVKPIGLPGPIKIGCSRWTARRLVALNAWAPFPLEVICEIDGTLEDERRYHHHLRLAWSHSEWFYPTPKVIEAVELAKAGKMPAWDETEQVRSLRNYDKHRKANIRRGLTRSLNVSFRNAYGYGTRVDENRAAQIIAQCKRECRDLTLDEERIVRDEIARLKAMGRHPLARYEAWRDAGMPTPAHWGIGA